MRQTQAQRSARYRERKREKLEQVERLEQRVRELSGPINEVIAARMSNLTEDDFMNVYRNMPLEKRFRIAGMVWWDMMGNGGDLLFRVSGQDHVVSLTDPRIVQTWFNPGTV
jgi:hypothetical protein